MKVMPNFDSFSKSWKNIACEINPLRVRTKKAMNKYACRRKRVLVHSLDIPY